MQNQGQLIQNRRYLMDETGRTYVPIAARRYQRFVVVVEIGTRTHGRCSGGRDRGLCRGGERTSYRSPGRQVYGARICVVRPTMATSVVIHSQLQPGDRTISSHACPPRRGFASRKPEGCMQCPTVIYT
jgi:hypothetical protein